MSLPTISVVIPTCDRPEFLVEAVQSVLDQSLDVLEVIVIDDASQHDPGPQLARFGAKLRYDRLPRKSGANVARNRGIALSRGGVLGFLDDDDLWLPDKLEAQLAMLHGKVEACLCTSQEIGKPPRPPLARTEVTPEFLKSSSPCGTSGLLVTRAALEAEAFDPVLPRGQDWDLFVRLAQRHPLGFVGRPLYLRRTGHARITTAALRQTPAQLYETAAAVHKHRGWLGEAAYRRRLARVLLSFISQRRGKLDYISAALHHAGWRATLAELWRKIPIGFARGDDHRSGVTR